MENQHRKITGYRELSQHEIDLMNKIKAKGEELQALTEEVRTHITEQVAASKADTGPFGEDWRKRLANATPERWNSVAVTHFQQGLMALTRAVAQPTSF